MVIFSRRAVSMIAVSAVLVGSLPVQAFAVSFAPSSAAASVPAMILPTIIPVGPVSRPIPMPVFADLAAGISVGPSDLDPGQPNPSQIIPGQTDIQVNFKTGNNGPAASKSSVLRVQLPRGLTVQIPPTSRNCRVYKFAQWDEVECRDGVISPNSASYYNMKVQAAKDLRCPGSVSLSARITSAGQPDPNYSNNAATKSVSVVCAAEPSMNISFDGPVTGIHTPGEKDVVLANVNIAAKNTDMGVSQMTFMVRFYQNLPDGKNKAIDSFLKEVELRNTVTGRVVPASLFQRVSTPEGQYGLYRVSGFSLSKGSNTLEFRGDFTPATRGGDQFVAGVCTTALNGNQPLCNFSRYIRPSTAYSVLAYVIVNGKQVRKVTPGGVVLGNVQKVGVPTLMIKQEALAATDNAVANQKNINLFRFKARTNEEKDILFTGAAFRAGQGDLNNAVNYSMWVDTDGNGVTDTILQKGVASSNGKVIFDNITGGGYVITTSDPGSVAAFEIHADVAASPVSNTLQLAFATDFPAEYIHAETLDDGANLLGISTDQVCVPFGGSTGCQIFVTTANSTVWSFATTGNLYVTKSTTPLRAHQLLGGSLGEPVLRLKFRAEKENIDVTKIRIMASGTGAATDVDHLELYLPGASAPFTIGTTAGCGADPVPAGTFCAPMMSQQLVVNDGTTVEVLVRPRMRSDQEGAVSGDKITFLLPERLPLAIEARGFASSNNLSQNDGDAVAEGEIFVGTNAVAPNQPVAGNQNVVVLSKVTSIVNANPDANGTNVPTGVYPIGQFKFTAAANNNSKNGLNKWTFSDVIFTVNASNVQIDTSGFKIYNKADPTNKVACPILDSASGATYYNVVCWSVSAWNVDTEIGSGEDKTFVLEANIQNPSINQAQTSSLGVSLQSFTNANLSGISSSLSHLRWLDKDSHIMRAFTWVDYPETTINSTSYVGAPSTPVCGDGVIESPEQCDDGNTVNGDGCSAQCVAENMSTCLANPSIYWDQESNMCHADRQPCSDPDGGKDYQTRAHTYGFREVNAGPEDARIRTGGRDACVSSTQLIEHFCYNTYFIGTEYVDCPNGCQDGACKQVSQPVCGNGVVEAPEQCDDGNTASGDGCSATCTIESIESATLNIAVKSLASSDLVVANQKNVTLLRFEARASEADVLFTLAKFGADNSANATNYALWVDTDNNGVVDTILQKNVASVSNIVTFDSLPTGGYVIPKDQTAVFEVHADISSSLLAGTLQEAFAVTVSDYIGAKQLSNEVNLVGIKTNGSCPVSSCAITVVTTPSTVFSFKNQGDLYVTKSTTPIRNRQLLGGTLADNVFGLKLHAEAEPIDVTKIRFSLNGNANDLERVELYQVGATTPFAVATVSGCGSDTVPANTVCASMMSQQLVVDKGSDLNVLVRPRMRSDNDGAASGHDATFGLISSGSPAVEARGLNSSNNLSPNDGDSSPEGEVFVGTSTAGPDQAVTGNRNVVVLSKVSSITNADPNANGTAIPTGSQRAISQFKFSAYSHSNSKNGMNKVGLNGIIYNVNAANVLIDGNAFKIYNKADAVTKASCIVRNSNGTVMTGSVTGMFSVECSGLLSTAVNTLVDPGTDSTFVLETSVINSKIDNSQMSILQVSLQNFGQIDLTTFGVSSSHMEWQDQDNGSSPTFRWIEYPETVINGTTYQD